MKNKMKNISNDTTSKGFIEDPLSYIDALDFGSSTFGMKQELLGVVNEILNVLIYSMETSSFKEDGLANSKRARY